MTLLNNIHLHGLGHAGHTDIKDMTNHGSLTPLAGIRMFSRRSGDQIKHCISIRTISRAKYIILFFFSVYVLTGCHFRTIVEILNNTGTDIVIVSFDSELNETSYNVENGKSIQMGIPSKLEIRSRENRWRYNELRPISGQFVKRRNANTYVIRFQMEKNRGLYIALPDTNEIALPQPTGYPLNPE